MNAKSRALAVLGALLAAIGTTAHADTVNGVSEDFTGDSTANSWYALNGACLTAKTAPGTASATTAGQLSGCVSLIQSYYHEILTGGANGRTDTAQSLPDPSGQGALRFTNGWIDSVSGGYQQNGAILSRDTFPTGQGLQITFKTVTYRGNSRTDDPTWAAQGGKGTGADGISFILMNGNVTPNLGSWGGSLAYTCSNVNLPPDGMQGAYIGLGIDEFGNFLNGANYVTGYTGPNQILNGAGTGDNSPRGFGYRPNRFGIRGGGNISWAWLHQNFPTFYPLGKLNTDALRQSAVQQTCKSGTVWDFSRNTPRQGQAILAYPPITFRELPPSLAIAREYADGGIKRSDATPIIYDLNITQDGLLSFAYSFNGGAFQNVINKQKITDETVSGPLPSSFRFAFAAATGGGTNIHEILCFKAQPITVSSSSTGTNDKQSARVENGTQAYFAYYNPRDNTGRVTSNDLRVDTVSGDLFVAPLANWDGACVLTGVASGQTCPTTGTGPVAAIGSSNRTILTWNGTKGIPFRFGNLTSAQQNALDQGDTTPFNSQRLDYLRGSRAQEITATGSGRFRARNSVLGDIIDSSPVWVGPPQLPYTGTWQDRLYPSAAAPENTGQRYAQFITTRQTRENVVYVGANDGLLHGFRSGAFDTNGQFSTSQFPNDGFEVFAYMPGAVVNTIHNATNPSLDFASTQYGHNYFVNAVPGTGDLFYSGGWHTLLMSGLQEGGAALFALDVTDPPTSTNQETRAADLVIGEWNATNLTCANVANCGANLGKTYGVPQIRRLHNGMWSAIIPNGLSSASGDAGLYIMTVNPSNGAKTFYYLSTHRAGGNGIAYVTPADLDGDHVVDYVYAGDVLGNVWRFDLTADQPASWKVSGAPLFSTPAGQPITTRIVVASGLVGGGQQLIVAFGTGQKFGFTNTAPVAYIGGNQSIYGVWDWDLSAWNLKGSVQYASLAPANTGLASPYTIKSTDLQPQPLTVAANGNRDIATNATVCWAGTTLCTSGNTKFGWSLALPGTSEQIVFNPQLLGSAFLVNSVVPANNSLLSCTQNTDTGFTYAVSVLNGGAFRNFFPQRNDTVAVGVETDATGTSFPVTTGGDTWLVHQTVRNEHETLKVNPPSNSRANRLTWIQLR